MKNVKNGHNTCTRQVEWMDREATSVDIDAIDTDMHARSGDAELVPWLLVADCAPQVSFCERHRGRGALTLVVCYRV